MGLIAWSVILSVELDDTCHRSRAGGGHGVGVIRHYWVVIKLLITVLATAGLLLHMQPISRLGAAARAGGSR